MFKKIITTSSPIAVVQMLICVACVCLHGIECASSVECVLVCVCVCGTLYLCV